MATKANRTSAAKYATGVSNVKWQWASAEQYKAFCSPPGGPIVLSGGFGAGKTLVWARKIILLCDLFPGSRWVILRSSFEHLKRTTMPTFFGACPPEMYDPRRGGKRVDSDKYVRMANGSEVLWMHLDHPESVRILKGLEPNGFMIDQAEDVLESTFDIMMGRLGRWKGAEVPQSLIDREPDGWKYFDPEGKPMPPSYALLTVNPDSKLHWIYKRFHPESKLHFDRVHPNPDLVEREHKPFVSYSDMGYRYISMHSTSNRFLSKDNLGNLLSKSAEFQARFVYDEWGTPKGTIHSVSELSKIPTSEDPKSVVPYSREFVDHLLTRCQYKFRVLDHGDTAPTACTFWAMDSSGNLYCYLQYYQADRLISYHRRKITELSGNHQFAASIADPAIFNRTMQNKERRFSVAEMYYDSSHDPSTAIYWMRGDNEELATREKINEYLAIDPAHRHPVTGELGAPHMYFLMRSDAYPLGCYEMVDELESQRRELIGETLEGEKQFSEERDPSVRDHGYDTIRYMVAYRPIRPRDKVNPNNPHGTFDEMAQEMMRKSRIVAGRNPVVFRGQRIIT